jgi:histidyl-tRNA synthetase
VKALLPKGTRDFSPYEMVKRIYIFDTIRIVYQKYGYQQIETPSMELTETLTGKYGEEGDRLIFKILPRGEKLKRLLKFIKQINLKLTPYDQTEKERNLTVDEASSNLLEEVLMSQIAKETDESLRYDLTVPFARYVVQHQNEITFPFKRFQIQPVWRADRPQKGRYREFYQCDADVIGSTSLLNEIELIQIIRDVFSLLKVGVEIRLNNRKILSGIADVIGEKEKIIDITVAIDKLDKIGLEKVNEELKLKGLSDASVQKLQPIINLSGSNVEKLDALKKILASSETGMQGIEECEEIFALLGNDVEMLMLDLTLARGLNYYTGSIIEVKVKDERSQFPGSICGGGRYDDLTGIFGLPGVSGVGISFGADRIYDVLDEVNGFPELTAASTKIMFVNFGKDEAAHCLKLLKRLRTSGINAELFPDAAKMKKQMGYADDKKIPFVALVGSEEIKTVAITVKNMKNGEQHKMSMDELVKVLKAEII